MQKATVIKNCQIYQFDYNFSPGEIIEYKYKHGHVLFNNITDANGSNTVTIFNFHKAFEKGNLKRD